jgi:hypothetical protein
VQAKQGQELVFGAVAGAGDPDEEIVVQKVVPTRPELSLEIGVLWLGLGIPLSLSQEPTTPPVRRFSFRLERETGSLTSATVCLLELGGPASFG